MAIPNPSKAKELLDSKRLRDSERQDAKAKAEKAEAAEKTRQLKYAKLVVEEAFKAALDGKRYTYIADGVGEQTLAYLNGLGFEVARVEEILKAAERVRNLASAKQTVEIEGETAKYEKLVTDLVYTICVWVNVRYPGMAREVAPYFYDELSLGANYSRIDRAKSLLESWISDSDEDMEFSSLISPHDQKKFLEVKNLVPKLPLNYTRVEKLQLLSDTCLKQINQIREKLRECKLTNFRLIKQIEDWELEADDNILTWDTLSNIPAKRSGINAPLLEWLSTESGLEYMSEADLSVKAAARAGYDSVTLCTPCAEGGKAPPKATEIVEVFRKLGFSAESHGATFELRWG